MHTRGSWLAFASALACGPVVGLEDESSGPSSETSATTPTTATTMAESTGSTVPTSATDSTTGILDGVVDWTDFPTPTDVPGQCGVIGPAGLPGANLPYLWVANPADSTVFKIHTQTLVIEGEYATAPAPANPSSTSVALSGMVAVANREGSITAFHGSLDRCPNPGSTSAGPGDVLGFGTDGCLAWHVPLGLVSQAPVAWGQGSYDEVRCEWDDEWLWTAGVIAGDIDQAVAYQIEGETGIILAEVQLPGFVFGSGPHGGVTDDNGNLWLTPLGDGSLVRVDAQTLLTETWPLPVPAVGLAFDPMLGVWSCGAEGVARFDQGTSSFVVLDAGSLGGPVEGCASYGKILWLGGGASLRGLGLQTWMLELQWPMPEPTHGVAVDFDHYVWAVGDSILQRTDIRVGTVDVIPSITTTTMSDMTGFQVAHITD